MTLLQWMTLNPTQLLTCNDDWLAAKTTIVADFIDDQLEAVWLNLLCHVRNKSKKGKPRKASQQQSQSQEHSQDPFEFGQTLTAEEPIDWKKEMPFGFDKTLRLCIQGPTYEKASNSGNYHLLNRSTEFAKERVCWKY